MLCLGPNCNWNYTKGKGEKGGQVGEGVVIIYYTISLLN